MSDPDVEAFGSRSGAARSPSPQSAFAGGAPEELNVFRDALVAALTANGALGRLRAQLRLAAIDACNGRGATTAKNVDSGPSLLSPPLAASLATDPASALAFALVDDFLAFHGARTTQSVWAAEAAAPLAKAPAAGAARRQALSAAVAAVATTGEEPLLVTLLRAHSAAAGPSSSLPLPRAAPRPQEQQRQQFSSSGNSTLDGAGADADIDESGPSSTVLAALNAVAAVEYPSSADFSDDTADSDRDLYAEGFDEVTLVSSQHL